MLNMLHIGMKSILLNQQNLNATSQNISNMDTDGYSRQRVIQESSAPIQDALGYYGTGADLVRIERMRDVHLDESYREENSQYGSWNKLSTRLQEFETSLNETDDNGLSATLDEFWNAWDAIADNPDDITYRQELLNTAELLVTRIHDFDTAVKDMRETVNEDLAEIPDKINAISEQLAKLNKQIYTTEQEGRPANDLRDKFDLLIDELSQYGDVTVTTRSDDTTVIYLGSDELVKHDNFRELITQNYEQDGKDFTNIIWKDTREQISALYNGEISGLMKMRDEYLVDYQNRIDNLAVTLAEAVNSVHVRGYDLGDPPSRWRNFFKSDITSAADFNLDEKIIDHPERIAASEEGAQGDNRTALAMVDLRESLSINGDQSFNSYLASTFGKIGRDSLDAANRKDLTSATLEQTDNFRESVKGVSMNEESANLLKFQKAFQAAAKIVTVADELLQTIIAMV